MSIFRYQAFGHHLVADFELPALVAGHGQGLPPIHLHQAALGRQREGFGCEVENESVFLWWHGVADFTIRGNEIAVARVADCPLQVLQIPLLGPVLAIALQRLGHFTLHGNAVQVGQRAAIFVGDKGRGKSTTTTALLARGHRLISDDVSVLSASGDQPIAVLPGFPSLKLWKNSLDHYRDITFHESRPLWEGCEKFVVELTAGQFASRPIPLGGVYILEIGEAAGLSPVGARQAFQSLLVHTYGVGFPGAVLTGASGGSHLRSCSHLINRVPVKRLQRTTDLRSLDDIVRLVETDLQTSLSATRQG